MKTYNGFLCERAGGPASPEGRMKAAKAAAQNSQNRDKKNQPGALAIRPSSALNKAADKGSAIVRQKQGGTDKEAIGKTKSDKVKPYSPKGYMSTPDTGTKPRERPENKFKSGFKSAMGGDAFAKNNSSARRKARNELGKKAAGAIKSTASNVAKGIRSIQTRDNGSVGTSSSVGVKPGQMISKYSA